MLTLASPEPTRHCQGYSRRDFLRVGALGLGGLTLSSLLAVRARAAEAGRCLKDKAVVLLFLQGGPPHIETFDPKMSAPEDVRSATGEVQTALPGVTFGGTFPQMAKLADRLAVVRSFGSGNADHQNYLSVAGGGNELKAPMGTFYARVAGANDPKTGMPTNVLVTPEAASPGLKLGRNFETQALPALAGPGQLGAAYAAFNPGASGDFQKDLEMKVPRERFDDRRELLRCFDDFRRGLDVSGTLEAAAPLEQQAYDMILRGAADAFDLSKEDPRTLERYDTTGLFRMEEWTKFENMRRTSNLLGKQMLLARRLVEAGCGFVTVTDAGWDLHADSNSAPALTAMTPLGGQVDHAVAAFLDDVKDRGLDDKILLVITGEMGRTPRINKKGGRDHYADLTPLVFAGGGLKAGQVIGQSDRLAAKPAAERYTPQHLLATVMNVMFDVGEARISRELPKAVSQVIADGAPIPGLL
jgi:uncharacterized protein (DUF1501 family)